MCFNFFALLEHMTVHDMLGCHHAAAKPLGENIDQFGWMFQGLTGTPGDCKIFGCHVGDSERNLSHSTSGVRGRSMRAHTHTHSVAPPFSFSALSCWLDISYMRCTKTMYNGPPDHKVLAQRLVIWPDQNRSAGGHRQLCGPDPEGQLHIYLPSSLFCSSFPTKILCIFIFPVHATWLANLIFHDLIILIIFGKE
jgi:hypothetical protein